MFPAILARGAAALERSELSSAAKKFTPIARKAARLSKKPNKLLKNKVQTQSLAKVPTTSPAKIPSSNPRINVQSPTPNQGNREVPDTTTTDQYREDTTQRNGNRSQPNIVQSASEGTSTVDTLTRLALSAQLAKAAASSFIPSITWTGTISARGWKSTPLRTVLHYCLAAVFGMVHQSRIGSSYLTVETFPNENRVEVVFVNASSVLLEPLNLAIVGLADTIKAPLGAVDGDIVAKRVDGQINDVINGIRKYLPAVAVAPLVQVRKFMETAANAIRLIGPGGIWDMAQTSIYAGNPPSSLIPNACRPFLDIVNYSNVGKRPMLTRKLAINPQGPRYPEMHFPTHYDLRSLVAQALYDPGVIPPVPDTYVALPEFQL